MLLRAARRSARSHAALRRRYATLLRLDWSSHSFSASRSSDVSPRSSRAIQAAAVSSAWSADITRLSEEVIAPCLGGHGAPAVAQRLGQEPHAFGDMVFNCVYGDAHSLRNLFLRKAFHLAH